MVAVTSPVRCLRRRCSVGSDSLWDQTTSVRDGFAVLDHDGNEVHFCPCDKNGRMREKVEMGMVMRTDTERFIVVDTRWNQDD